MIADSAKVVLIDGTVRAAIDLQPGTEVMTVRNRRMGPAAVVERTVENHNVVVCLILANGQRIVGSRDQRISVWRKERNWFTEMANVEPGMQLGGEVNGMPVTVRVIGVMFQSKQQARLVGLTFEKRECFVVEGIWCR